MTAPNRPAPEGAYVLGSRYGQNITQQSAMSLMTNGAKVSWDKAQTNIKSEFASSSLVNGEIVRLDNRIDTVEIGTEKGFRYTYSESGVWDKHPAAYKVIVDVLSGATSGRHGARNGGGAGGFSGGWEREEFTGSALEDLPPSVAINIGAGTVAGNEGAAGSSSFGSFVVSTGATIGNYGSGSRTYKMRGGTGMFDGAGGSDGSDGPFGLGGSRGRTGSQALADGGHGFSVGVNQIGPGSAGGGGGNYNRDLAWAGGRGGHGGWPAGPGGGGGGTSWAFVDFTREGGNGAAGAVIVTVLVADEFGAPPSTPTDLAVSNRTRTSARVTWTPSIDDVMVKHYVLHLNGTRYGVVTPAQHDFVQLSASTTYEVRVQAVDIGGNASELSAPLSFTTTA